MILDCAWGITSALQYNNDDYYSPLFFYYSLLMTHLTIFLFHAVRFRYGFPSSTTTLDLNIDIALIIS